MKVNLIQPNQSQLERPNSYISLGLAYLGACLEKGGHEVTINDLNQDNKIKDADIHGVQCHSRATYDEVAKVSYKLHDRDEKHIIGGMHATIFPEETQQYTKCDAVVTKEPEFKISDIVQSRLYGQIIEGDIILDLDKIPYPARHLFNNVVDYSGIHGQEKGVGATTIISARGCPWRCRFCTRIPQTTTYREHSPEYTVGELHQITENYDVSHVRFVDDEFTLNKTRIAKLCKLIANQLPDLTWLCITRVDTLNDELLRAMKEGGCTEINVGVESGSQRILDAMNKQMTTRQLEMGVKKIKRAGITAKAYIMYKYPGETEEDRQMTLDWLRRAKPDKVTVSHFTPLPGSELWNEGDTPWFYRDEDIEFQVFKKGVYKQLK